MCGEKKFKSYSGNQKGAIIGIFLFFSWDTLFLSGKREFKNPFFYL